MKRVPKRDYTADFREQAVAMVNSGRSVREVAGELGLIDQTLRNWVKAAGLSGLDKTPDPAPAERMELLLLRAENAQLKESLAALELEAGKRSRELGDALDQQTATAEILRVISSSPTDLQPVFDAILENATRVVRRAFRLARPL